MSNKEKELVVKQLTSRYETYPDTIGSIVWEVKERPDYVDAVDLKLHIAFLVKGRVFKDEIEKFKTVIDSAIRKNFKDAIPAMVADIEKVTNA